jgi:hypothetical protein
VTINRLINDQRRIDGEATDLTVNSRLRSARRFAYKPSILFSPVSFFPLSGTRHATAIADAKPKMLATSNLSG